MKAGGLPPPWHRARWVQRMFLSQDSTEQSTSNAMFQGLVGGIFLLAIIAIIASHHAQRKQARSGAASKSQYSPTDAELGKLEARKACIKSISKAAVGQQLACISSVEVLWRASTMQRLPPVKLGKERVSPPPSGRSQVADSATSVMAAAHTCIFKGASSFKKLSQTLSSIQIVDEQAERLRAPEIADSSLPVKNYPRAFAAERNGAHMPSSRYGQSIWARGASAASIRTIDSVWRMCSWELDPADVQLCRDSKGRPVSLGIGGFGKVYKAEMAGSTAVAVKYVTRQSPKELRRFAHEIGILKSLRHTNIVQFLGAYLQGEEMVLVTEYMKGGDLHRVLGCDLNREFGWHKRGQQVALDVVRGIVHMHARKVIHLDIKSANILLARDGTAKIADVGLAKVLSRENTCVSMESTFDWAAPEVLAGFECSEKADIWSLGVVLWEIITGERPHLRQLRPIRVPQECPQEVKDVVTQCRASEPANRPSARQVFARLSTNVQLASSCPERHAPGADDSASDGQDGSLTWSMPMRQPSTGQASPPPMCNAHCPKRYPMRLLPGVILPYEGAELVQPWQEIPLY